MSLVFAAVAPHPPLLIPSIGKEQIEAVAQTKHALEQLERDLYISKPQVICIISPHGSLFTDAFCVNAHTHHRTNFAEFGDLATKKEWQGTPELAAEISHEAKMRHIPVQLVSQEGVDHGVSVPLFYLTNHLPEVKILPLGYSGLNAEKHVEYGELLKEIFMRTDKRIAVIASGDLSHCLTVGAPSAYHADGPMFDKQMIEMLEVRNTAGIMNMDVSFVENAAQCGYRSILITLGVLKNMNFTFKNYSYEAPFGVGYLVGNFSL